MKLLYNKKKDISRDLYGIFLEDINFSVDGGLNNNQLCNPFFKTVSFLPEKNFAYYKWRFFGGSRKDVTLSEKELPLYGWRCDGDYTATFGAVKLSSRDKVSLINDGFVPEKSKNKKGEKYGIGVKKGHRYEVKFRLKSEDFVGKIIVCCVDKTGEKVTESAGTVFSRDKAEYALYLDGTADSNARFVFSVIGKGTVMVSEFYFGDTDCIDFHGKNRYGGRMRKDLVEALKRLCPRFVRFPGGCLTEGYSVKNAYCWKDTVGIISERKPKPNVWGEEQKDGVYMQSYEIGFYEYFLLCEELGAKPLPIVYAGLACQARSRETLDAGSLEKLRLDILDLIAYANGTDENNVWTRLRIRSGHPEPFGLTVIGIGNENFGKTYENNFSFLASAVKKEYPDIDIVYSAGFHCYGSGERDYEANRAFFDRRFPDCICDDHFYRSPEWVKNHVDLYDDYPRTRSRVFLGEYAANGSTGGKKIVNTYLSALSEAAFMTGLERNADIVCMSSYAPLFSRVGFEQWKHNMINFSSLHVLPTANYFVQEMFSANVGDTFIPVDKTPHGVFVTVTEKGGTLYIKSVNMNREPRAFLLETQKGRSFVRRVCMSCADDFCRNDLTAEGEPIVRVFPKESRLITDGTIDTVLEARSVTLFVTE